MTGRRPRFLQLNTLYPAYVRDFYAAHSQLEDASFQSQLDALLDDGFSGPHMMTRGMAARGWDTFHVIANAAALQKRWLAENDIAFSEPFNPAFIAAMQIEMFRPDVVYILDPCAFDSTFVRKIPTRPTLVTGWRGFPIPPGTDWSAMDVIFTSFDAIAAAAPQFGAKDILRHYPGFPEDFAAPAEDAYDCDVIFSGSVTSHHRQRVELLHEIWQASQGRGGEPFTFHLHMPDVSALPPAMQGSNRGSLWGHDMLRALARARITINIDIDTFSAQPPNMRLIEATGAGAFLLTTFHPDLPRFFAPGQEIETFQDGQELLAKIRRTLADEPARRKIAAAGKTRCRAEHGLARTTDAFHDMVTAKLSAKREGR
jgi:spore maturation protein CgeB